MSGMDGVGRGSGPIRPGGPDRSKRTKKAKGAKKTGADFQVGDAAPADSADTVQPADPTPKFDGLSQRILDGVDEELSKEEILHSVIDDEVERSFGKNASKKMTESIARAFDTNEGLKALFNRLYSQALRTRQD